MVPSNFWSYKNVLVTGGSGFIGSHLVELISRLGANVVVYDDLSFGDIRYMPKTSNVTFKGTDIRDIHFKELDKADIIYHLAAISDPRYAKENPELTVSIHVDGTLKILEVARRFDIENLCFTSTVGVYGKAAYIPMDENHPTNCYNDVYSMSKLMGEQLCKYYHETYGLPYVILRLTNNFGPRQKPNFLVPSVILQAIKKGVVEIWTRKPTRDFIYVKDTVNALIKSVEACGSTQKIYNIGTGKEIRVGIIIDLIIEILEKKLKKKIMVREQNPSYNDQRPRSSVNNKKAKEELMWDTTFELKDALNETIDWYLRSS